MLIVRFYSAVANRELTSPLCCISLSLWHLMFFFVSFCSRMYSVIPFFYNYNYFFYVKFPI